MRKVILLFAAMVIAAMTTAQSYNSDLYELGQYVQRMYLDEPFQGARIVENVDNCYLITVVAESPGDNDYLIQRKAEVKGMSYANTFLNGAHVSQNTIIHTKMNSRGYSDEEIEDFIEARSMGYVQTMQVISTFTDSQGKKVFVYCKQLPMPDKPKGKKGKKQK